MNKPDEDFLKRIRETFRIEAIEHLRVLDAGLSELEKKPDAKRTTSLIENLYREVHSLKGAARSIDMREIESVCHPLESLFAAFKQEGKHISSHQIALLFKATAFLNKLVSSGDQVNTYGLRQTQKDLIGEIGKAIEAVSEERSDPLPVDIENTRVEDNGPDPVRKIHENQATTALRGILQSEVVRIPVSRLDPILFQAEELFQTKISIDERISELKDIHNSLMLFKSILLESGLTALAVNESVRDKIEKNKGADLADIEQKIFDLANSFEKDQYAFQRLINDHLSEVKRMLMLPVTYLVESFPGMVREISQELRKETRLIMTGTEIEIDKRILEEIKDPLLHLIRNSIDHGIERSAERVKIGKEKAGTISLKFRAHGSDMIEIVLSDDGKGIDPDDIRKAAVRSGLIKTDVLESSGNDEIISLIFRSGISTKSIISDISGRGLGLSIVSEKVEKLNGKLSVKTEIGKGTSFHILLPVTLATFRGVLINTAGFRFIIPTTNILKVLTIKSEDIKTIENHDTLSFNNRVISVIDMKQILGLSENSGPEQVTDNPDRLYIILLTSGEEEIAVRVDEVLDEEQILVKSLGKLFNRVRNISGASILGSGNVVPVLYVPDLIRSAVGSEQRLLKPLTEKVTGEKITKILVAEDSVTSRALLKNILETAGYQVTTAVDGKEAYTKARIEKFDLIVSDVDMPRMNGFELTTKIRSDKKLNDIPIVLVTALDSREDRERGIEVGADAYIVKGSFDQTNLLEIIKKLI